MPSFTSLALVAALALSATAAPSSSNGMSSKKSVEVQGHRGGLGLRSEESLFAYAYSLEIGVNTLEMDTLFTSDGIPVIWHDHKILATKCSGPYVGQFIANLTLAQVKEMNCTQQLADHPQAELHATTRIYTLEEVLDLVDCYGDKEVNVNLETKLDPTAPAETLSVEKYINDLIPILVRRKWDKRVTIQSFDWRTLVGIHKKWPYIPIVALLDGSTIVPAADGSYPWLNNIDLAGKFKGDWVAAAKSIGSSVLSPVHGTPSSKTPNTPGYVPFVTKDVVARAHKAGMQVIPWTVDYEVTIEKLLDDGVDAIISNYPERVMYIAKQKGYSVGKTPNKPHPRCLAKAGL